MRVVIYSPRGKRQFNAAECAAFANHVHQMFTKGEPYIKEMYEEHDGKDYRLGGCHCDCGCDETVLGRPTLGEFELLPMASEEVQSGQKAYMFCRKCGCYSHL